MLRQIGEILLPSCGAAVFTGIGIPPIPEVATCIDVYVPATANVGETITIEAYLKTKLTGVPLGGKTVYYLISPPLAPPIPGPGPTALITDAGGKVTFTYTVTQAGVHRVKVVFLGEGGPFPLTVEEGLGLCPILGIVSCLGPGIEPPTLPEPPGGGLGQPPCGIMCGSSIEVGQDPSELKKSKIHGLEPDS